MNWVELPSVYTKLRFVSQGELPGLFDKYDGVKISGATVHFVNEKADAGAIILQGAVDVANDDTPETLQLKIMQNVEWKLLPKAVSLFCEDRITVKDGKAYIDL